MGPGLDWHRLLFFCAGSETKAGIHSSVEGSVFRFFGSYWTHRVAMGMAISTDALVLAETDFQVAGQTAPNCACQTSHGHRNSGSCRKGKTVGGGSEVAGFPPQWRSSVTLGSPQKREFIHRHDKTSTPTFQGPPRRSEMPRQAKEAAPKLRRVKPKMPSQTSCKSLGHRKESRRVQGKIANWIAPK